ncbi:hypothetical protein ASPCAL07209 [Aspergillus calidoustus]|uniref:Uncharacterized protein n=1 Tax=Aspergillus calidoustus TaxID=454130 RepID=A0A0U5GY21_ASPCI|nr:hypothetical protein ASPCAL07209 [Aspergillus calidoustus]
MSLPHLASWIPPPDRLSIVLAHYRESHGQWINLTASTYLYARYDTPQAIDTSQQSSFRTYELLPNIIREGQTYCHHIHAHYADLQPMMIFTKRVRSTSMPRKGQSHRSWSSRHPHRQI